MPGNPTSKKPYEGLWEQLDVQSPSRARVGVLWQKHRLSGAGKKHWVNQGFELITPGSGLVSYKIVSPWYIPKQNISAQGWTSSPCFRSARTHSAKETCAECLWPEMPMARCRALPTTSLLSAYIHPNSMINYFDKICQLILKKMIKR